MGKNLTRAPLVGVFYAAVIWFLFPFLPRSQGYAESFADFSMGSTGLLLLLLAGVVAAVACAIVYSGADQGGVQFTLFLFLLLCLLQWLIPSMRFLLLGDPARIMTQADIWFGILAGVGAGALTILLCTMLYQVPAVRTPARPGAPAPRKPQYKLATLGLVIRLLVLPVIFCLLYYFAWYFLLWRVDAAREFYGQPERLSFMAEIIAILIERGREVLVTLLIGLAYSLCSFLLATQMREKRMLFIGANTLLYLTGALLRLVPRPALPDSVRMAHFWENGALLLVFGVVSGLLLQSVFQKIPQPAARPTAAGQQRAQQRPGTARPAATATKPQ